MKSKAKHEKPETKRAEAATSSPAVVSTLKHLKWGWWGLLVFLSMGILLEMLHGFKVGAYLDVPNTTRRMMWTLAHAHGTLLSLVHIFKLFVKRFLELATIFLFLGCGTVDLFRLFFL